MTSEAESERDEDQVEFPCVPGHLQWSSGSEPPPLQNSCRPFLACNSWTACVFSNRSAARLLEAAAAPSPAVILPRSHPGAPLKALCTYVSPFDVSLQESVTSELNYLVARGRQACPMVCAPPPTLSVTHAFPHLALSAPPAAYLHGFSTLTLISCHPAVQGAAERRLSRGKGAPDHVRGGSACRRLIRMAPES